MPILCCQKVFKIIQLTIKQYFCTLHTANFNISKSKSCQPVTLIFIAMHHSFSLTLIKTMHDSVVIHLNAMQGKIFFCCLQIWSNVLGSTLILSSSRQLGVYGGHHVPNWLVACCTTSRVSPHHMMPNQCSQLPQPSYILQHKCTC